MPFPNDHSARLRLPGTMDPDSFRRTSGGTITLREENRVDKDGPGRVEVPKTIDIVWAKLKDESGPDDPIFAQSLRFNIKTWTVAQAKKWLSDNNIKPLLFEPATNGEGEMESSFIGNKVLESWVHKKSCFMNYLGVWMVEPSWIECAVSSINNGTLKPIEARLHDDDEEKTRSFAVIGNGIAVIDINGPMMKGFPKIVGTSTVFVRHLLKLAINDPTVEAILLNIDSPGGHVAGTQELADAVFKANKIKSVFAHIDDLGASAAFWVASQTARITANKTSEIGAIGAVAIINDTSKKFENEGIKVHVIASGPFKGDGADGVPVTDEMIDMMRVRVEDLNTHFLAAVASGRNLNAEQIKAVSDGRVFIADKALKLGLIDSIQSLDTTIAQISSEIEIKQHKREMNVRRASAELKFAKEF